MADRYVDHAAGNDSNDGLTTSTAWKTMAKVNAMGAGAANLSIGLLYGSTWNEAFTVPAAGMTFGAYGTPSNGLPVIDGTSLSGAGWTDQKASTVIQDIKFTGWTGFAILRQPPAGSAGGLYRRLTVVGTAGGGAQAQGINWSQDTGGRITGCTISNCYTGVYPTGAGYGIRIGASTLSMTVDHNIVSTCFTCIGGASTHRDLVVHHNVVVNATVDGIDIQAGVAAHPPQIYNNTIIHSPGTVGQAGHGLDSQLASVGPIWRNNIVVGTYAGTNTNVQLYTLSPTGLSSVDVDYDLGFTVAGGTSNYAKNGTTAYASLTLWKAALTAAGYAGAEAHGIQADPSFEDISTGKYTLQSGSPCLTGGVVVATYNPTTCMGAYIPPVVSGSTPVGSTLTCTPDTYPCTYTLAYQWTRDGSNIGSATSSTYTTVTADGGHAIGCKVTVTQDVAPVGSGTMASSNTISVTADISLSIAGTSSLAATLTPYERIMVGLSGTASLSAAVTPYRRITVAVVGTSSLTATVTPYHRITVALAGTSTLAASVTPYQRIAWAVAGISSLTAAVSGYQQIAVTLAGTSTLTASSGFQRQITVIFAGTSSLHATVTSGGVFPNPIPGGRAQRRPFIRLVQFTLTLIGTSTLEAELKSIYGTGTSVPPGHRLPFAGEAYFDEEEMAVLREFELI